MTTVSPAHLYDLLELEGCLTTRKRLDRVLGAAGVTCGALDRDPPLSNVSCESFCAAIGPEDAAKIAAVIAPPDLGDATCTDAALIVQREIGLTAENVADERVVHQEAGLEFNELLAGRIRDLAVQFNEINDKKIIALLRTTVAPLTNDPEIRAQIEAATLSTISKIRQKDRVAAEFVHACRLYDRAAGRAEQQHLRDHLAPADSRLKQLVKAGADQDRLLELLDRWADDTKKHVIQDVFREDLEMDLDAQILRLTRKYLTAAGDTLSVARLCAQ